MQLHRALVTEVEQACSFQHTSIGWLASFGPNRPRRNNVLPQVLFVRNDHAVTKFHTCLKSSRTSSLSSAARAHSLLHLCLAHLYTSRTCWQLEQVED